MKVAQKGRKCKYPHCEQVLSVYNRREYCHVHLGCEYRDKAKRFQK